MVRRIWLGMICAVALGSFLSVAGKAHAQQGYGHQWAYSYNTQDWQKFYHYPYVFYPQNFRGSEYYRSAESLYFRYPQEMRIPVYNRQWQNYYPQARRYHSGHHFHLDVF